MAEQGWGSVGYVMDQFRRYYQSGAAIVEAPQEISRREFGFLSFEGKVMLRHLSFDGVQRLRLHLAENPPAHVYYSSAYYVDPEAEMERKGWLGADLVFDIDADHIDTPCKAQHDRWRCRSCGGQGTGAVPEKCPSCGKESFDEETWVCERCLETAKYEAQKLLDILIQDLGLPPEELRVNFTGNRGYHVHVENRRLRALDQLARREIVDYIMGTGIRPELHGFGGVRGGSSTLAEGGWRGRSARALYDYLTEATPESIQSLKLGSQAAKGLIEERGSILGLLRDSHPSSVLRYIDPRSLGRLMEAAVREQASAIDTVVTTDLHRLIRLPNTLHGKTGWLAQAVALDDLEDYDPLTSAIAFTGSTEKIYVKRCPRFRIGDELYGPYQDERVELPMAAAMFLLCRKAARVER